MKPIVALIASSKPSQLGSKRPLLTRLGPFIEASKSPLFDSRVDLPQKRANSRLASRLGVPAERIVIGAGSNELLFASGEIALDPGDEAVAPDPGFVTYAKIIAMRDAIYVGVPVRTDGVVDAIMAAVTPSTRLVYVATPNNPTGGMLVQDEAERLIAQLPDHLLLHYDEAYYEFGCHAGGPEALPLLGRRRGPWIVTRTFSKAYSLAGARVGYGIASSREIADAYLKIRINFSVNAIALAGARAALDEAD